MRIFCYRTIFACYDCTKRRQKPNNSIVLQIKYIFLWFIVYIFHSEEKKIKFFSFALTDSFRTRMHWKIFTEYLFVEFFSTTSATIQSTKR